MQLSVSDLKTVPDYEKEFITHRIAMYIAAEDMTLSQMLEINLRQMCVLLLKEGMDRFLNVDWSSIIQEVLGEIAVPREVKDTKCYLIKDDTTWVKYVNLYSASPYELDLDTLHERYNLVRRRAEPTKPNSTPYCLPPPQFNASHVPAESLRPLRLLLHTDAVVIPAVHLLHQKYLEVRGDRSEDAPTSAVDPATVLHAITVLYLAVQDSLEVYHAQCRTEGGPIGDWKVVEDYLAGKEIHRSAFTEESVSGYCPLPELRHASSIKERLVRNITESASSTAEVLAGLRLYYKSNPSLDKFSYVRMIEFILTQTSLADFEEDCSEGDQTAAGPNEEEARLQRIKAKQKGNDAKAEKTL
ncbi:hypothetical protein AGDE_16376 [Angomonas deanei]|nr:hypothetical protein AGDE_16376 [Angomonas deanei]|eukprot:EPY17186.1 hypothetical protein AGDE_16376 [Angomonas deanei]